MTESVSFEDLPKRRLKPDHLRKKRNPGKFDHAQFIAWDGEGVTDESGIHRYILFANSLGHKVRSGFREDGRTPKGCLPTQCFALLTDCARHNPKALHVIYYGSYDFNMLLRGIPRKSLERLRRGQRIYFNHFSLEVKFGKSLWVRDRRDGVSVTLWDVGSFFQQSFVKSLKEWSVDLPEGVLDNIIAQKLARSSFSVEDFTEIERYCDQELDALVKLMGLFRDALDECGIRISQWHGPGAIADFLYRINGTKAHKEACPDDVNRAAQYAYGGGRIELIRQGNTSIESVYNYDIRSCYPWAIANLPSLSHSKWEHATGIEASELREFSLYNVRWNFPVGRDFYPVRHRNADGSVCYPTRGVSAWIWSPEYSILNDLYAGCYEVIEAFHFTPGREGKPFSWVADMYAQRMEWKAQGYGAQRILKLGLNSLYGKMIQQLGWSSEHLPAWHQLEWGGYVTSAARAAIYRASHDNPSIVGFETDGILSLEPLNVALSEDLGGWELTTHESLTYVQTGFYWLDDKVRYRGFDTGSVTREAVLKAWESNEPYVNAQLTRHIGLNYAAHTGRWHEWGNWVTTQRDLDVHSASSKRIRNCGAAHCSACANGSDSLATGMHSTRPYPEIVTAPSAPYPLAWRPEGLPEWKVEALRHSMEMPDFDSLRFG